MISNQRGIQIPHKQLQTWSSLTPTSDFLASPILIKSRSADGVEKPVVIPPGVIPPGKGVWKPPNFLKKKKGEIMVHSGWWFVVTRKRIVSQH